MKKLLYLLILYCFSVANIFGQVTPEFTFSDTTCYGDATTLIGSSALPDTSIASWNWDLDNDGKFDDANGKSINSIFLDKDSLNFTVRLYVISKAGPSDSISKVISVFPLPEVNFRVDNTCELEESYYIDESTIKHGNITSWQWDFHNDGLYIGSGKTDTFTNITTGSYLTKLTCVSDQGCEAFATKTTSVFATPIARFNIKTSEFTDTVVFENTSTIDTSGSDEIIYNIWDFNDKSNSSIETNPQHLFLDEGTFTVKLKVISENFCMDSTNKKITVWVNPEEANMVKVINNVITPNGDGINDFLRIKDLASYNNSCELIIYNIWNDVVYNSSSYNNDWDGTYEGSPLDGGTYFYIINCTGKEKTVGSISILK